MHVYSKAWRDIREPEEWRHDTSIPMPGFYLCLAGAAEGYALLRGIPQDQNGLWFSICSEKTPEAYFTLEFKTLLVERLCVMEFDIQPNFSTQASLHRYLRQVYEIVRTFLFLYPSATETCDYIHRSSRIIICIISLGTSIYIF
jgi:hypothetical protein